MLRGVIVGDNFTDPPRSAIGRASGAHRIATLLRNRGVDTHVLDFFNAWTTQELEQYFINFKNIDFLGFSFSLSTLSKEKVKTLIAIVKKINPNVKVIAGGARVLFREYSGIDMYFNGVAEEAVDDIVKYIETGKFNLFNVTTISKGDDKKQVVDCLKKYPFSDLKKLTTVYTDNDFITPHEVLALEVGRGCIFKCTFCHFPLIGKNKNDYIRDKEDIKSELIRNYEKYGVRKYFITDDTFNDNEIKVDLMYEISKELPFDLLLVLYIRVDLMWARENVNSLDKLYAMGVRGMFLGIESFKESTGKKIGKGFSGQRLLDYLSSIKQRYPDINITASTIVGLPNETFSEFSQAIHTALDRKLVDAVPVFALYIMEGTEFVNTSIFSENYEKYGYTVMSDEEVKVAWEKYKEYNVSIMPNSIPWKNEHTNFLEVQVHSQQILKEISLKNTTACWAGLAQTHFIADLDESTAYMNKNVTQLNWEQLTRETRNFISQYIKKKINSVLNLDGERN